MTAPVLDVEGLRFRYPDGQLALAGVDLRMGSRERLALLGPNGAGKTTFAHHLNGILEATEGTVTVAGTVLAEPALREIRRRVGLVFQDPDDQLFMPSVREDVAFGPANLGLGGADLERRVEEALKSVGIQHVADRAPHHLSGGEKRRASLATVLSMQPDLLVLDEPDSGLDPAGRRELIELLADLPVAQLVITHDLPLALELCPRSVIMDGGRVVADGPTVELLADTSLLAAHRLELPYGFDPALLAAPERPGP